MLAMNSDYKRKRDKLLDDVYTIGKSDASLKVNDWKELQDGVREALDALLLEVVFKLVDQMDNDYPQNSEARRALHTLYSKAEELINPKEEV